MLIKVGDRIRTQFLEGRVIEIIQGRERGWRDTVYYAVNVTRPVLHWKRRYQIVRVNEVKAKAEKKA